MRFKLLRRRLTISAPRLAIRSALPWPLRWAVAAVALGFCGAIALWAFEFGRDIAGLERITSEEVAQMRSELERLRTELLEVKATASAAENLLTTERTAQASLATRVRELEADNAALRDDLGFFERLLPVGSSEGLNIRGLQAERVDGNRLRWQVLVIQPTKNAPVVNGQVELQIAGTLQGRPWQMSLPDGPVTVQIQQYRRLQGTVELPADAVVKTVTARLSAGGARSTQTVRL